VKYISKHSTASPAVSSNPEQYPDTDEIRTIAHRLGTGGSLYPYLQNHPDEMDWFETIGDDVAVKLRNGEPVSKADIGQLYFALGFGESRKGAWRDQGERRRGRASSLHPQAAAGPGGICAGDAGEAVPSRFSQQPTLIFRSSLCA
jgi:hypothetical protein